MALAALIAGLVAFVMVLRVLAAERHALQVIKVAQDAMGVITDPDLSDDIKEKSIQRASLSLMKTFFILLAIGVAACVAAALFVLAGDALDLFTTDQVMAIATSWSFILWSSVGAIVLWVLSGKLKKRSPQADTETAEDATASREEVPYSAIDKALHNYAFSSPSRQIALSSFEDKLWKRTLAETQVGKPVFVTSLPRAGTTILLELLARQEEFASASYRNMPFTMSPLLWGRFSSMFRKKGEKSERAHGDGIAVDFDSPEAFEEMVWMAFWREHYTDKGIKLWGAEDRNPEFEEFLSRHMRKIVASVPGSQRYVSKNNANIARLPLLDAAFPEAQIVIPVRDPASQISSLMRQHQRFADLHSRDRFARQYMEGIGHFEFGAALRPIAFPGAPQGTEGAEHADYWLRYWIAAYEHVLSTAPAESAFVDHAALSRDPETQLPMLAEVLGVEHREAFNAASEMFRAPGASPELPNASADLVQRANDLYAQLQERAL
ncbi:sulfotransferase [Halomonas binhaiensis]|uniref:Sulfotransferase n=1 Tax=Halomonas binhaiensis TaxID=2562282 RepID=A0A5C1NCQ8_9GAMM|nr:sulfotransferase [Halomonas binhaiensis]QEM80751.1 sulfotransferase [Halomonas binhaiensis]